MTDAPPLLTRELLDQLEARWRAQGAPITDRLQAGLTGTEMAEIVAPVGLSVPAEARVWFGWHDGARTDGTAISWMMTGLGWKFFPLRHAVEQVVEQRTLARELAGDKADEWLWRHAWLPLADNFHGGMIVVDGTRPADQPATPVFYTEPQVGTGDGRPRAATLGEMVTWWLEAMDAHLIDFDAEAREWRYEADLIDPAREHTRLV